MIGELICVAMSRASPDVRLTAELQIDHVAAEIDFSFDARRPQTVSALSAPSASVISVDVTGGRESTTARFEVPEGGVAQGYRFALDPTPAQVSMLESHCGAARFAFNHMLGVVKANLDQRSAERSYGIAERGFDAGAGVVAGQAAQDLESPQERGGAVVAGQQQGGLQLGLDGLARALANWSTSRSGERAGAAVGFPRFKSRHRSRAVGAVHHRRHPCRGGPPSRGVAADRADPYA